MHLTSLRCTPAPCAYDARPLAPYHLKPLITMVGYGFGPSNIHNKVPIRLSIFGKTQKEPSPCQATSPEHHWVTLWWQEKIQYYHTHMHKLNI